MSKLRSPLSRAIGLGSAKDGTHHWWMMKVTSVALIPLTVWFVAAILANLGADHATAVAWIGQIEVAVPMLLFLTVGLHHMKNGLQVVIEDYVGDPGMQIAAQMLNTFVWYGVGAAAVFAVLKMAFGG